MKFEFFEHTADIKFRAYGKSLNDVFSSCAKALSNVLAQGGKIKKTSSKKIEVEGEDTQELLYKFLDELLYLLDAENFVVSDAKVKIKDKKLKAEILGDKSDKYTDLDHVKAATYAEMYIKQNKTNWEAQVVLDV